MEKQDKENTQSSKKMRLFKFVSLSGVVALIAWLYGMIYVNGWVSINEDLYARTFMAWRSKAGDAAMFTGRYKGYSDKDLPSKNEIKQFLDVAQNEEGLLLTGNYPLHAPREPENLWSLFNDKVADFWRVELRVKAKLNKITKIDEWVQKAKDSYKKGTYDSDFKPSWFIAEDNISAVEIKQMFTGHKYKWDEAANAFLNIVEKLVNGEKDYGYMNGKVSGNLLADIKTLAGHAGYGDLTEDEINKFFYNMACVKAVPAETYTYSRLFNMWVFLTLNHDFKFTNPKLADIVKEHDSLRAEFGKFTNKKSAEAKAVSKKLARKKNEMYERMSKEQASVFALIFAKVYSTPYDHELKSESIRDFMVRKFGTSQDIDGVHKDNENIIAGALKTAQNNARAAIE